MQKEIINNIANNLLYLPELIFKSIRQKVVKEVLAGISPLHFKIMNILKNEGTLKVAEIADGINISRPQMTRLLDKLIELDMVEREPGTKDRRTINISLTIKGKSTIDKNYRQLRKAINDILSNLSDEDLKDLSDSFKKLIDILAKAGITDTKNL